MSDTAIIAEPSRGVPPFELRHRLARALEEGELTNVQMSEILGVGETTIRNYLKGRTRPPKAALTVWAMACKVNEAWLIEGTGTISRWNTENPGLTAVPAAGQQELPFPVQRALALV